MLILSECQKNITRCCNHRVFSDAITKPKEACMLGRLCGIFHIRFIFLPRIPNDCRTRQGGLVLNCPYPHKFQSLFLTKLTKSINSAVLQNRPSILSMYGRQLNESPVCAQLCKVLCSSLDLEWPPKVRLINAQCPVWHSWNVLGEL